MEKFNKIFHVDSSKLDSNAYIRLDHIFELIEIMITEYLGVLKKDNIVLKNEFNSAWVITKCKLEINKLPYWNDDVRVEIGIINNNSAKINLETIFYDKNNNVLIDALDEMCIINLESRRISRLKDIQFTDFILYENNIDLNYAKVDTLDYKYNESVNVRLIDVDFTKHCNNISYVRYIINNLDYDFFMNNVIENVTIHYLHESIINEKLNIYNKNIGNNIKYLIKKDDENVCYIELNCKKRV